jgi:hypothetical protein
MGTNTVIKLPTSKSPIVASRTRLRNAQKRLRRQTGVAVVIGLVAITLTALSLSHLAHGISLVTSAPPVQGWAMATGIDLGYISLELSMVMATSEHVRRMIGKFAKPAIVGTLAGSATMNAFAFASGAVGYPMIGAAVVLGVAIPAMVYALTRVGAALYIDCATKTN